MGHGVHHGWLQTPWLEAQGSEAAVAWDDHIQGLS